MLLAKGNVLEGESRSISEQGVDEREELDDSAHRDILTRDRDWSRLGHGFSSEARSEAGLGLQTRFLVGTG